jgi:hypothetical protein
MQGNNLRFLNGPEAYLRATAIECYNVKSGDYGPAIEACGVARASATCAPTVELDLVPVPKAAYVTLKILGPIGTYGRTGRHGRPIVGGWMPYTGQLARSDPERFGHINADDVPGGCPYIFTVGVTGCNVVAVRKKGGLHFYHEPTQAGWSTMPDYDGDVLCRVGPKYGDKIFGGYALMMRDGGGGWNIHVQSHAGTAVADLTTYAVPR